MTARQDLVRFHRDGQTLTFQVKGWGTMTHALPIRRLAEQGLACGATQLRIDLRHCTYMDSTFLGTLIVLLKAVFARGRRDGFALVCPSAACCKLLQQMGVDDLFPRVTAEEVDATAWTPLGGEMDDVQSFKCNVVQAHVELANQPGPAAQTFGPIARRLTEELEAEKKK
jgi:anti-anti-sigma regulatory factor